MLTLQQILTYYPEYLQIFKRNILREYLQSLILHSIYQNIEGLKLIFMGGTALRIIHGNTRFSEDLDFDNQGLSPEEMNSLANKIKNYLQYEGYSVEIETVFKNAYHCYIKIPKLLQQEGLSGHKEEKILIQLDAESQNFQYAPQKLYLNKFGFLTPILVVPLPLLLAQKIYAAFHRNRMMGRDFYDILYLWTMTNPDYNYLKTKLNIDNKKELLVYLKERANQVNFKELAKDLGPFVFNSQDAKKIEYFPGWLETQNNI